MKNFIYFICALLWAGPCTAASNMKMVTYFPVPYASYNDVSVTGTADVGLMNACTLDAGNKLQISKGTSGRTLDTGTLIVREGGVDLNSSKTSSVIKGLSFQAGDGNSASKSVFEFKHDLNVNTVPALQTAEATNKAYLSGLKLFPDTITSGNMFPKCETGEISWKKLKVGDSQEAFLICGAGQPTEPECEPTMGSWIQGGPNKDTCNGDSVNALSACPAGLKGKCYDVRTEYETPNYTYWGAEEKLQTDTCDGNITARYTCKAGEKKNCVDVIVSVLPSYRDNRTMGVKEDLRFSGGVGVDRPMPNCPASGLCADLSAGWTECYDPSRPAIMGCYYQNVQTAELTCGGSTRFREVTCCG